MAFTTYDPDTQALSTLTGAFVAATPGMSVVAGSVVLRSFTPPGEASALSFYDGSLGALGIGAGLLLTNGDPTPATSNTTIGEQGTDTNPAVDNELLNAITVAYDGDGPDADDGPDGVFDVTSLQFTVNITDPAILGVRLDFLFGSEEAYPGAPGDFPDIAGVFVNGTNYALFNDSVLQPIAVTNRNIDAGLFVDNEDSVLPIEYNGATHSWQVTAPVHAGQNVIRIAVADTGEDGVDSGLFVSNLQATAYGGFGIAQRIAVSGTGNVSDLAGDQVYLGDAAANHVTLGNGLDVFDGGAGVDTASLAYGPLSISGGSWDGKHLVLDNGANAQEMVNVERLTFAGGYLFAIDTQPTGHTYLADALLHAALNGAPDNTLLSRWTADADVRFAAGGNLGDVAQDIITAYAPGATNEQLVGWLYTQLAGVAPSQDTITQLTGLIGPGHTFGTFGDLYAAGAMLPLNTDELVSFVGSVQQLDSSFFG